MTGDRHVRFYESRRVRLPPATHLTLAGIGGTLQFVGGVVSTTNVPPHSMKCSAGAPMEWHSIKTSGHVGSGVSEIHCFTAAKLRKSRNNRRHGIARLHAIWQR